MKKRLFCAVLAAVMLLSLAACGKTESVKLNTVQLIKAENNDETLPDETPEEDGNGENAETPSEKDENAEIPSDGDKTPENGETSTPAAPSGNTAAKPTGGNKTPSQSGSSNSGSQTKPSAPKQCNYDTTAVRNKKDATVAATGYTGDTYCKKCGALISGGTTIPKIKQTVSVSHDYYDIEMQIFNEINAERTKAGLPALVWDENLYAGTKVRAKEFKEFVEDGIGAGPHKRPDGREFYTAIEENSSYSMYSFSVWG